MMLNTYDMVNYYSIKNIKVDFLCFGTNFYNKSNKIPFVFNLGI